MRSAVILLLLSITATLADEFSHRYQEGDHIDMWVNKVGPYRNPQETYKYYSLPYCAPILEEESRWEGLGEALQGFELVKSDMQINFRKDLKTQGLCVKKLDEKELNKFIHAVKNQYWYQLFCDDLPIWGMVGDMVPESNNQQVPYLYTHKKFTFLYNEDRIIEVNLTSEAPVALTHGVNVHFTYSVEWHKTEKTYKDRFEKYLDESFFEHQIHWFAIFNSFMMVIFLTGLVSMILMRTLRKDYARYTHDEEDVDEDGDNDYGWKQIHGDVFRPPAYLPLFSALVGTGHQLIILTLLVIIISSVGHFYVHRGTTVTVWMLCYLVTSFVAGYGGGGYYHRNGGKFWIQTALLTAFLFPGICFSIAIVLDVVAMAYGSLAAIPIGTMIAVLALFVFISVPLTFVGTLVGRHWNGDPSNPCRINPVPRLIVEKKWYLHPLVNILLGGILPFGSIFIEMYFMFTSFWHYKYYYVYGFLLLVFLILIVVSVCVTIVSTYFLLNSEDYRWQWVSFLSSASTAGYVFLYCIYYFFAKTKMSGFFQTVFYFGYMGMFCIGLGILCGAVGFIGTSLFVRRIYHNLKIE